MCVSVWGGVGGIKGAFFSRFPPPVTGGFRRFLLRLITQHTFFFISNGFAALGIPLSPHLYEIGKANSKKETPYGLTL